MISTFGSMIGLIGAGIIGFIVGVWTNVMMSDKILPPPTTRCRICLARHDDDNHEQFERWDA